MKGLKRWALGLKGWALGLPIIKQIHKHIQYKKRMKKIKKRDPFTYK